MSADEDQQRRAWFSEREWLWTAEARLGRQQAEIDSLRRDLDAVNAAHDKLLTEHIAVMDERNQLRRDLEACKVDAERYRWLRDTGRVAPFQVRTNTLALWVVDEGFGQRLDAAIDAARARGEGNADE